MGKEIIKVEQPSLNRKFIISIGVQLYLNLCPFYKDHIKLW
jgi:hypothetical protein